MPTYSLPRLPVGWHWQQHLNSFAFVVARGPDGQHSKPLLADDKGGQRRFVESLGIRASFQPTQIPRVGYSLAECEQMENTP